MEPNTFTKLNYNRAMAGLDLVVDGKLRSDRVDEHRPLTHRFLGRLLDQLDAIGRPAAPSEHTFLLRAIRNFQTGDFAGAVANGHRAAEAGNVPMLGGIEEPDLSLSLRDALGTTNDP
jgi:hypothetical protein